MFCWLGAVLWARALNASRGPEAHLGRQAFPSPPWPACSLPSRRQQVRTYAQAQQGQGGKRISQNDFTGGARGTA